jgi:pimeloyl-ACP methyl ester carboxylesterase
MRRPWAAGCIGEKVTTAAWHDKPSFFVVAGKDKMINPKLQQSMAKDIGAHVINVDTSHVAMLSQPTAVAETIIAAAQSAK